MQDLSKIGYISTHTVIFAQSVIHSIKNMAEISFSPNRNSFREMPFSSLFRMIAYIHFTGSIQGNYIVGMEEITAAKLAGIYKDGMNKDDIHEMREEYGGFIKELLNLAAAQSIQELEQIFGNLTYTPATVVYGEIEFPDVMSGNIKIESRTGEIQCGFSLNLARLKISWKLEKTLQELEKTKVEADKVRRNFEKIMQKIPSGVVAVNAAGKILPGHSRATALVTGHNSYKIEGSDLALILGLNPEHSQELKSWIKLVFSAYNIFPFEKLRMMCKKEFYNSQNKIFRLDWLPVVNHETKALEKLHVIIEDITEKRRLEDEKKEKEKLQKQLRQAQKMEAIGTLAGGIAHDFNNIIQVILGNTELSMSYAKEESRIKERLECILYACNRARNMVKQLLTISRQAEQERVFIQVSPIIKETLQILKTSIPSNIKIHQKIKKVSDTIFADPVQIHQVLMNLCINAAHSMEEKGGSLNVELDNIINKCTSSPEQKLPPGNYLKLSISDTGCGINPDNMEKIFEPFFTTKEAGKGTGLGLSVVHGIIKNHDGIINVYSEPGKGTVFHIYLPVTEHKTSVKNNDKEIIPGGTERILFIDDEKCMADMAYEILMNLGYKVSVYTSTKKAVKVFRAEKNQFDLVITDQTMPEMNGIKFAGDILSIRPDIPVILCTGFSRINVLEEAKAAGIREVIMKPYSRVEISQIIRQILDSSKEGEKDISGKKQ